MAGQVCANPILPQLRGWRHDPRGRLRAPEADRDLAGVARRELLRGDRLAGGPVVQLLLPAQAMAARLGREKPGPAPPMEPVLRAQPSGLCGINFPSWASAVRVILRCEGLEPSESTVGRILDKGLRLGRIMPCAYCRGRTNAKAPPIFNGHAKGDTDNAPNAPENSFGSITCRSPGTANNSRSSNPSPPSASTSSLGSTPVPPPTTPNASSRPSG